MKLNGQVSSWGITMEDAEGKMGGYLKDNYFTFILDPHFLKSPVFLLYEQREAVLS